MVFTARWRDVPLGIWYKITNISREFMSECGFIINIEGKFEDNLESWSADSIKGRIHYDLHDIQQCSIYFFFYNKHVRNKRVREKVLIARH